MRRSQDADSGGKPALRLLALFAEMRKMAAHRRVTSSSANLLLILEAIYVAVAWAKHAIG